LTTATENRKLNQQADQYGPAVRRAIDQLFPGFAVSTSSTNLTYSWSTSEVMVMLGWTINGWTFYYTVHPGVAYRQRRSNRFHELLKQSAQALVLAEMPKWMSPNYDPFALLTPTTAPTNHNGGRQNGRRRWFRAR
jgi:hypothetical protein